MALSNVIVRGALALAATATIAIAGQRSSAAQDLASPRPWMNPKLSPDERASLIENEMSLDEKLVLLHGYFAVQFGKVSPPVGAIGSAGYVPGIPRLGIPALQESDASLGVANPLNVRPGDGATALPSGLAMAASFDTNLAQQAGAMIGSEAWHKGFNVLLAGGVNLARDPRNGRNFEYLGEDPLLAGSMAGASIAGIQSQHVVSTVKHFALNDQETNRNWANSVISENAAHESDLLAFELAIQIGHPGAVMCGYNLVNGSYDCSNRHLLTDVLKSEWHYPGWVMSDWGAVNGLDAASNGLDQESAAGLDKEVYFDQPLKSAVQTGSVPPSRLDDMDHRILRSLFAVGIFDDPPVKGKVNYTTDGATAQKTAEEGIVLLKNDGAILPLADVKRIAVIGGHADAGVLSGAGSSQVIPDGGPSATVPVGGEGMLAPWRNMIFDPSSPLLALRAALPDAEIRFDDGRYPSSAAAVAKWAQVVIVFANQWMIEGDDAPDLSLPEGQDQVISAAAAANPRTVVVLETGGPVLMPWLGKVAGVVEAWYPGQQGGSAIANVLTGRTNPSGRLPITFPTGLQQYPRPTIPGAGLPPGQVFDVQYDEGAEVGYRWFARQKLSPLFPFGYGLSYTKFDYHNLSASGASALSVSFDVTNSGNVAGMDAPQVYLTSMPGGSTLRLIGFEKLSLAPGETRHVKLLIDPRLLSHYDATKPDWRLDGGSYRVTVGHSATDLEESVAAKLAARTITP